MNLEDWLPIYPEFDQDIREILGGSVLNYQHPSYDIYRKKEFSDYKLEKIEDAPVPPNRLFKHQVIISRFLSSHTPYKGLLLMHEPGTGKTCSSIAAIEQIIKKEKLSINKALILVKNDKLIANYKREILKCADYLENAEERKEAEKLIKKFYEFQTFEKFIMKDIIPSLKLENSVRYKNFSDKYSNHVIVVDEIHNLRNIGKDSMYKGLHQFLHAVSNCKIILMSGTPMKDKPEEIADIMNLILPSDGQLPVKKEFREQYLDFLVEIDDSDEENSDEENSDEDEEDILSGKTYVLSDKKKIKRLKGYLHGRVSVLKTMNISTVKREYIGNIDLGNFKLFGVELSDFQKESYKIAYELDRSKIKGEKKGVYNETKQCMSFVFPDETYGTKGFAKYVDEDKFYLRKSLTNAIMEDSDGNIEKRLSNLRKYSSKYAKCIEMLLNDDKSSHFVFMELEKGGGAIVFSRILELFGFENFSESGNVETRRKRYALVTGSTGSIGEVLEEFNKPRNKYGEYVKVIIGTRAISEGYTLKNVQNIHILVPAWNFGSIDQAIARGIRLGSHNDLIESGKDVTVKIYMYCSTLPDCETTDLYMYKKSRNKDLAIKSIEHVMKEASFDCALNKERNQFPEHLDYQRLCEYKSCEYDCDGFDGVSKGKIKRPEIDESTYNLYYDEDDISEIIRYISKLFKKETKIKIETLLKLLKKFNETTVMKAIEQMRETNEIVKDRLGKFCFVRYDNDYIYLTYNLGQNTNFFDNYYVEHFPLRDAVDSIVDMKKIYIESLPEMIDKMLDYEDDKKQKFFNKFDPELRELLLEETLLLQRDKPEIENNRELQEFVLSQTKGSVYTLKDGTIISTLNEDGLRCLTPGNKEWSDCDEKYVDEMEEKLAEKNVQLVNNDIGYYVITEGGKLKIAKTQEEFKVKADGKVDKRSANTGRDCATWDVKDLLKMVDDVKMDYDEKGMEGKKSEELMLMFTKSSKSKNFSTDEFEEKDDDDKKRLLYFMGLTRPKICQKIKEWFEKNHPHLIAGGKVAKDVDLDAIVRK